MVFITRPDIVSDMVASAKTIINPSAEDPVVVVCADGAQSGRVRSIDLADCQQAILKLVVNRKRVKSMVGVEGSEMAGHGVSSSSQAKLSRRRRELAHCQRAILKLTVVFLSRRVLVAVAAQVGTGTGTDPMASGGPQEGLETATYLHNGNPSHGLWQDTTHSVKDTVSKGHGIGVGDSVNISTKSGTA